MGKLFALRDKLNQLTPERMDVEILTIVKKNEETVTNMNTDQLFQGQDSKGNLFQDYSERSVKGYGKRPGPIRWFETGRYYASIFIDAVRFPILFGSTDQKEGKIADTLASQGRDIKDNYGLQKHNQTDLNKSHILPAIQKFSRNFLGI